MNKVEKPKPQNIKLRGCFYIRKVIFPYVFPTIKDEPNHIEGGK